MAYLFLVRPHQPAIWLAKAMMVFSDATPVQVPILVRFNARNIDAALALMTSDVAWPRAFKGGFVRGHEEVRAYWKEQWSEIDPHVESMAFHSEGAEHILVDVHQVVRDLAGAVVADEQVGHGFTFAHGLIQAMEVGPLPLSTPKV